MKPDFPHLKLDYARTFAAGLQKAISLCPQTILLDSLISKGMGYELCRVLKSHPATKHIPIIMLLPVSTCDYCLQALQTGADAFLHRPVTPRLIAAWIEWGLTRYQAAQAQWTWQTQRLEARIAELQASESRYRSIVENANEGLAVYTPDGRVSYVNHKLCQLLGYTQPNLIGSHVLSLVADEHLSIHKQNFVERQKMHRNSFETKLKAKGGELIPVLVSATPLSTAKGEFDGAVVAVVDLRPVKDMEEALCHSEAKYRSFFQTCKDCTFITTPGGEWIEFNAAAVELFGFASAQELYQVPISSLYANPEDRNRHLQQIDRQGYVKNFAVDLRKKDGSLIKALITSVARRDENGEIVSYQGTIRDVTVMTEMQEKKVELEVRLHQAQQLEAIGLLAGGIAHDFNNILSAVMGYSEMSLWEVDQQSAVNKNLQEILRASQRGAELVNQILTFCRQEDQKTGPVEVIHLVKETLQLLKPTLPTGIEINQYIRTDQAMILGSPSQVHQIIVNLCINAVQAMGRNGGQLCIELDRAQILTSHELRVPPGEYVCLAVSDSGPGIAAANIKSIFEPYFSTKKGDGGTGLGLTMVQRIVAGHNGTVRVQSCPGIGTTFFVYLPVLKSDAQTRDDRQLTLRQAHGERILLIDDEVQVIDVTRNFLESSGFCVEAYTSPAHALSKFQSHPESFDVLITNVHMPEMSGLEVAQAVHAIHETLPIILVSGFPIQFGPENPKPAYIRSCLKKPCSQYDLMEALSDVLYPSPIPTTPNPVLRPQEHKA